MLHGVVILGRPRPFGGWIEGVKMALSREECKSSARVFFRDVPGSTVCSTWIASWGWPGFFHDASIEAHAFIGWGSFLNHFEFGIHQVVAVGMVPWSMETSTPLFGLSAVRVSVTHVATNSMTRSFGPLCCCQPRESDISCRAQVPTWPVSADRHMGTGHVTCF